MLTVVQRLVVSAITQALIYGIYLATLIQCFRWLIFTDEGWKPRDRINSLTIAFATIFIFLTSTTNLINTLQLALECLVRDDKRHTDRIVMAEDMSAVLALLSIDGVLVYRCWIVYAKSWRAICVPGIFWLASLACSVLMIYYGRPDLEVYIIRGNAIIGLYSCIIGTTLYTTAAIIYRIWYTRKTSGGSPKRLNYIMRILAESGILYTSTTILSLATFLVERSDSTWVGNLLSDISNSISFPMAGVTYNLILIRVHQSRVELRNSLADSRNVDGEASHFTATLVDVRHPSPC